MGKGLERLSPKDILELLRDERVVLRKAPPWKRNPFAMHPGTKEGLRISVGISQACRDVLGTAIDPETGNLITRKALAQKELARKLRENGLLRR